MARSTEGNERSKGPQVVAKVGESLGLERSENGPAAFTVCD